METKEDAYAAMGAESDERLVNDMIDGSANMQELQQRVHQTALEHGWWDEDRSFGDIVALIHSEVSEAFEEYRDQADTVHFDLGSNPYWLRVDAETGKPEGMAIEMADIVIRVMDYLEMVGADLYDLVKLKDEYNQTRPYRHGGKRA